MDMHIKMTEVKCLRGEAGDSVLKWSCKKEDEFNICGRCQSCVLSEKHHHYSQWMNKAGGASQRRFLTGILVRCHNLQILEDLQNVLQVTSGKDFTYSRSRALPSKPEDSMDGALDTKLHGMDMLETWEWFRKSPDWTKSKYVLGLLSLCDTPLLHMLANLVRVLIVWEKHSNTDLSVTGSRFSYHSDDPEECILYEPAGLPQEAQQGSQTDVLKQEYSEQIKDAKSLKSICHKVELDMQNLDPWNKRKGRDSDSDSSDDPDPALTVVPRSSKSLSGVSRHKDFIRRLPVDIAKIILGLLDKVSLYSCRSVSKHWQCLTDQILTEMEVKKSVEKHAMILQGNSTSKVNPVYAKICEVLVPVSEDHKHSQHRESFPKHKLAQEQVLDSVYKDFNSKTVQMEERNVYCGVYNILVLLEREDPSRVMHYAGGEFVAVGSRDRTIKLLHVASSKDPLVIQGHAGSVRAVLICEERDLVISASYDLSIRCWNLKTGVCTMIFHGHFGTINCLDLYGNRLVSGAKDCRVRVWNLLTGKCVENLKFKHLKPIMCVKINETLVVSGCAGGQIRIWSMETASLIRQISGHQGAVLCLCFDQWHILSGGSDGEVKVWSTNSCFEKCLRTFQHPKEVLTMSFLFLRIITGCMDGKIRIFNFLNGDCLRVIKTNMKQCPVLSLHTYHNTVVVNTKSSILMLQFAEVHWDYSASPLFKRSQISLENVPHSASQITRGGSPSPKSGFHRIKNLSTPSLQHARDAQKESTREVIWSQLKAHRHSRASINLQSECLTLPRSVLSAGRPVSGYKNFQNRVSHIPSTATTTINLDKKTYATKLSVLSQSEKAARDRVRKRGPHHPMTPDLILLRAGSCQQSWHSDLARSNMELNARVRDAWGPDSSKEPSFQTITKRTSEIHAPFATPSVDLNPQRSLQSRQTCFTSHSPPIQSQRSFKVIRSGTNKFGPLNTTSPEDGKAPQRLFMRRSSMPTHCHEDFEMTNMSGLYHVLLDPFRDNGAFQLRTDTQLEAFIQEGTRQQQSHKHGRGDQSKSVWKRSHCHQ